MLRGQLKMMKFKLGYKRALALAVFFSIRGTTAHAYLIQDSPWAAGDRPGAEKTGAATDTALTESADAERAPADVSKSTPPEEAMEQSGHADKSAGARGVRAHGD